MSSLISLPALLALWPALVIGLLVALGAWVGDWAIERIEAHCTRQAMRTASARRIAREQAALLRRAARECNP